MMPAQVHDWILPLMDAQPTTGRARVVMLAHVARFHVVINGAKVECVMWRDLLFEVQPQFAFFEIAIALLAWVVAIKRLEEIAAVPKRAELRAVLLPRAARPGLR